jgi:predicted ATPase
MDPETPVERSATRLLPFPSASPHGGVGTATLPLPRTPLVGRKRELAEVRALLERDDVPLVTLIGPGGVGKTRLALAAAAETSPAFSDGVRFVGLASIRAADLLAPAIAQALGVRERSDMAIGDRLVAHLSEKHVLLLLDNLEQIVDSAPAIASLLVACPLVTILATSRAPLRVSGEHVVTIEPLDLPIAPSANTPEEIAQFESVRLFVARARASRHHFALTDENAADVAEVVRRVDGLPLAIELAAARVAHLPPAALLARLDRRLTLLTGGARDLPERQQTMAATIAWSYDLLTAEEQALFRRLAIFVGGFTLEAAEAVAGAFGMSGNATLDGVAALVAMSLLRQEAGPDADYPRYVMLETVREFGLEQLAASGEEDAARRAHAAYFVALAEQADPSIWGDSDHLLWLDRLEIDFANFRAALTWLDSSDSGAELLRLAAALGGLWQFRSYRVEGRTWLTRALAKGGDTVSAACAMAMLKLGILERAVGGRAAAGLVAESMAMRRSLGDEQGAGHALVGLGLVFMSQGDIVRAVELMEDAAARFEHLGYPRGIALTRLHLGRAARLQGNTNRAQTLLTEALDRYRQTG